MMVGYANYLICIFMIFNENSTLIIWVVIKEKNEKSLILKKILEINEKSIKNQVVILTKLLISNLLIALEYQT